MLDNTNNDKDLVNINNKQLVNISIDKVKPGMILGTNITRRFSNGKDIVILAAGHKLDEKNINGLLKNNITNIDVEVNEVEKAQINNDIHTTVSEELKNKSIKSLRELNINEIIGNANEIVQAILDSKDFSYDLLEYKGEHSIYSHSVRVAAFASVLAKYYNEELNKNYSVDIKKQTVHMDNLAVAALVHDLGKTLKEEKINISLGKISNTLKDLLPGINEAPAARYDEKYDQLYTYCLLNSFPSFSSEVKLTTLLVGENEKESGPLRANSKLINSKQGYITASKIVRLCSIYDDCLKDIILKNEPLENISAMLEAYSLDGTLNKELTDLFIKHVPLYSVGVKVKLSDGRYAVVVETFTERINNYKPKVKIIPTGEIIDLRFENSLTVKELCSKSYAEIITAQIIDMNNEVTTLEQKRR